MPRSVQLSKNLIKNDTDRLTLISGPCLLENEKLVRKVAQSLIKYAKKEKFNLVFKCSFDKANRSSHKTIRHKISIDKSIDILKNLKKDLKIYKKEMFLELLALLVKLSQVLDISQQLQQMWVLENLLNGTNNFILKKIKNEF